MKKIRDYEDLLDEVPLVKVKFDKKSKKNNNDKSTLHNKKKKRSKQGSAW